MIRVSGALMKRIYAIGSSTGIVLATRSRALAADLPASLPVKAPRHSVSCVARTSLGDAIKQYLPRYFFHLRMTCNKAGEWMVASFDLVFDRNNWKSERTARDRWLHFISLMTARQ